MRTARIIGDGESYYHCMSRIIQGQMLLNNAEKERFRKILRAVSAFSGVKVLTYAIMTNHIHLLLKVPEKREFTRNEVINRIKALYGEEKAEEVSDKLKDLYRQKKYQEAKALLYHYTYRMHDLSQFMKMLMQRFTMSYNKRHNRRGHLWEQRFKSLLVEGTANALTTMSAYIDLNPVRAGLVKDPKDYRFSGYGEAVSGSMEAREGIMQICEMLGCYASWNESGSYYRKYIYMQAEAHTKGCAIDREKIKEVIKSGGKLSKAELLHCRVRYFSDGVVLGGRAFVEDVFRKHRHEFGLKRKNGARKPRYGEWGEIYTMRDLRLDPVSIT